MKNSTYPYKLLTFAACGLIILSLATKSDGADWWPFGKKGTQGTAEIVVNEAPLSRETKLTTSFSPIIKKTAPSIVSIKTSKKATLQGTPGLPYPFNDPSLRRFFGDNPQQLPEQDDGNKQGETHGLGSGVIVSKDGYILTNNHVVDDMDEIYVDMDDAGKKEFKAEVIGTDPRTDLAILKVDAQDLPAAVLGDSDQIETGDVVLAIGNPFGIGQTVTMGIISATGRNIGLSNSYENFIQTDAAINQGNSGGALIDAEGRVIGINTAIIGPAGGNVGIGFAIPINMARNVMEQIIKTGKVTRGYLGVMIEPITPELQESFQLPSMDGALVTNAEKGGSAEKAGLKRGDTIIEVDGKPIDDVNALKLLIGQKKPGVQIKLKVIRDGSPKDFTLTLAEMPDFADSEKSEHAGEPAANNGKLFAGVEIQDLDAATQRQGNIPTGVNGVLVVQVAPNCPAAEAGLRPGQVIIEIGNTPVASTKEAIPTARAIKSPLTRLYIWDRGAYRYLVIKDSAK